MNLIVLDFETFFSDDYTLKKMTTEAYIRDPRFEALCLGFRHPFDPITKEGPPYLSWEYGDGIAGTLGVIDWANTACLCHHAHFDGLILSHHYGIKPAMWFDTLSMARLLLGNHVSASLGALAKHFELPEKNVPYDLFRGKHWHELSEAERQLTGDACCHDVELTYRIFQKLLGQMPRMELDLIDMTVRMFTEPSIRGDVPALRALAQTEHDRKEKVLAELGVTKKELASAQQFAAILTGLGIEVEYKETPGGNTIPAVAKTDEFMKGLVEDENEIVSALATARLDARSTIDETRAGRLAGVAERGALPIYLGYCAAHTTRWGGGDKLNFQNFRRKRKDGTGGELRASLMAPDGHLIMTVDESQVECRFLEAVAGEELALQDFRDGKDPYCGIASDFYGRTITKADAAERGMGKQIRLSCLGPDTIVLTDRGPKSITAVTTDDRLWDGIEWISHRGLSPRGERIVQLTAGLYVTPDHQVLCGSTWREASSLQDGNILFQALATGSANLPYRDTLLLCAAASKQYWSNVIVELLNTTPTRIIYSLVKQLAAMLAPKKQVDIGSKNTTDMQILCLTTNIGVGSLDDCRPSWIAAQIRNQPIITATAAGGLPAFGQTNEIFWPTSLRFLGFSIQLCNWIEEITKVAMSQATSGLQVVWKMHETNEQSERSPKRMPTYDLAYAGPRNRFTVVTNAGPLIVHNCGYGAGGPSICATAKRGTYGPPVLLADDEGVAARDLYRRSRPGVVNLWKEADEVLKFIAGPAGEGIWRDIVKISARGDGSGYIEGPNGARMLYRLEWDAAERGWKRRTRKGWPHIWGGVVVQNLMEFLCRIFTGEVMIKIRHEMPWMQLAWMSHDELNYVVPESNEATAWLARTIELLSIAPLWLPNVPLAAEGGLGRRYEK